MFAASASYRFSLVVLLVLLFAIVGCDRSFESKDPVRSLPTSPPVPAGLEGRVGDRSITLTWTVSDETGIELYRVYLSDELAGPYTLLDSSTETSAVLTGLPYDHQVWLKVASVADSKLESAKSDALSVTAGLLSMDINDGDDYTRSRDIQIAFNVPVSAAYVEIGESNILEGADTRDFAGTLSYELSDGGGLKTVYARITFDDGSIASEIISDQITLDREARIDSVYFLPEDESFEVGDVVTFFVSADGEAYGSAQVSFSGVSGITLYDDGTHGDETADDGIYTADYVVPIGLVVVDEEVTGAFYDAAGNRATDAISPQHLNVLTGVDPEPVTLAVGLVDSTTAHLSWTPNEDSDFANYRIYRSVTPGINVDDDHLTVSIIPTSSTVSYDDHLSGTGVYYYRVFVFNTQGLSAGSNEVLVAR